jgi:hypothetical protein
VQTSSLDDYSLLKKIAFATADCRRKYPFATANEAFATEKAAL